MAYSKGTIHSPSRLKRFSHTARFTLASHLISPGDGDRILDYGTGDGHLLVLLHEANPRALIVGYEPTPAMYEELTSGLASFCSIKVVSDLTSCAPFSFNKIACLEVLEHLQEKDIDIALANMKALLDPEGKIVISVPIEIGPSAVVKNVIRKSLGQAETEANFANLLRSLFGRKVSRVLYGDTYGHVGFDYRWLERLFLRLGLQITQRIFSPVPFFGGVINSQVFYVLVHQPLADNSAMPHTASNVGYRL